MVILGGIICAVLAVYFNNMILGGVVGGIFLVIGAILFVGGKFREWDGKDEAWIEEGGDRE